jgi:hypothetical protein
MPEHRARKHHQDRVAETLREEIGAMIEGELSDPRIAFCYVTEVVLNPGGKFYATIYENPHGKLYLDDIKQNETGTSHYDYDLYHYDLDALRFACEGTGLSLAYEGGFEHPNNQKMVVFTKD